VFVAFIGSEKAHDRVDRLAIWQVLRMCGVVGKILCVIKSLCEESVACVGIGRLCDVSKVVQCLY
jgi:hypothetical protein